MIDPGGGCPAGGENNRLEILVRKQAKSRETTRLKKSGRTKKSAFILNNF